MAIFFIIAGVVLRLIPHLPNFAPIAALGLFGGVYLNKKYALAVPLLAMLFSDIFIGFAEFWVTFSIYLSFLLIGLIGLWLKNHKNFSNILGATFLGSVIFFLMTNFAVWAATPWYPKTIEGITQCYFLAIPFFKNTILGDLFYVGSMFGFYEFVLFVTKRKTGIIKAAKI
ncbi:MAG: hypothetical protein M1429_02500 [Patescibacteria group bacterium]|nr:hypothetical protein [Patescibacteria group bacterium]